MYSIDSEKHIWLLNSHAYIKSKSPIPFLIIKLKCILHKSYFCKQKMNNWEIFIEIIYIYKYLSGDVADFFIQKVW